MFSRSKERLSFDSCVGSRRIAATLYIPKDVTPKAVIQFAHGMTEHSGCYAEMAEFFAENGYVFAASDHLGHGDSVERPEDLGFFAPEDGADTLVTDLYKFSRLLKARFPDLPLVLMGHSMGSFLARLYATHYSDGLSSLVLLGTGGPHRLVKFGMAFSAFLVSIFGQRHRSHLLRNMAQMGYLSRCGKNASRNAWLTTQPALRPPADNKVGFIFTLQAYRDLFEMVERANRKDAAEDFPKDLPVYIASGAEDPVGAYGKGPTVVAERLRAAGLTDVTLKLYPEARHELHNEFCKGEFYTDLLHFLERRYAPS